MALKYFTIAEELRKEISRRGPQGNPKLPTEAELMRVYQVSRQTVRQALSVLLAEGLIEKKQGSGTYISPSVFPKALSSHNIALLVPDAAACTASDEIQGANAFFREAGYPVSIFSTENRTAREREILKALLEKPVRGMLVQGVRTAFPNPNLALYRELLLKGTSILFLGDAYPELNAFPSISEAALRTREREKTPDPHASVLQITPDDRNGGEQLARHLISLGHKKIAGIFRFDSLSGRKQYAGILHALCESSQPFDDRNFLWYDPFAAQAPDAKLLLSFIRIQLASCTAVICQDETIAGRLILELEKLGLSVPQRISVAAFGSREKYENPAGRITCVACQDVSPWKTAARLLMARINGNPVSSIVQPMALRRGESTGPAYRSRPE